MYHNELTCAWRRLKSLEVFCCRLIIFSKAWYYLIVFDGWWETWTEIRTSILIQLCSLFGMNLGMTLAWRRWWEYLVWILHYDMQLEHSYYSEPWHELGMTSLAWRRWHDVVDEKFGLNIAFWFQLRNFFRANLGMILAWRRWLHVGLHVILHYAMQLGLLLYIIANLTILDFVLVIVELNSMSKNWACA